MKFFLVEIFKSIQGEGFNFGLDVVFIRLSDCNLNCYWCDTDWKKANLVYTYEEISDYCWKNNCKNVIITGGEPTKNPETFAYLVNSLLREGFYVCVETNGINDITIKHKNLWISTSPKLIYKNLYKEETMIKHVDEMRIVVDPKLPLNKQLENVLFFYNRIKANHYYLSPCEVDGKFDFQQLAEFYQMVNKSVDREPFKISIQLHKLMNVR